MFVSILELNLFRVLILLCQLELLVIFESSIMRRLLLAQWLQTLGKQFGLLPWVSLTVDDEDSVILSSGVDVMYRQLENETFHTFTEIHPMTD